MKKFISAVLCLVMIFALVVPAFAAIEPNGNVPVIMIRGDGEWIYDANGEHIYPIGYDTANLKDDVMSVIYPYLVEAVLLNKWEPYYNAFADTLANVFKKAWLDENGEASNGSGVSVESKKAMEESVKRDAKAINGSYALNDYQLHYDWRLDPLAVADQIHEYIQQVKAITGASKVSLYCVCLGGVFVLGYLGKYGYDDIYSVFFDSTVGNGCELFSDLITGQVNIDPSALNRYYADAVNPTNGAGPQILGDMDKFLNSFIAATIDLMSKNGMLKGVADSVNYVYKKLYKELTPRLVMASFGTWPGYWGTVKAADYQAAKKMVFGKEGLDYSTKYAGLIEKLDNYDKTVRQRIPEIITKAKEHGCRIGLIAKYGYQQVPIYAGSARPGDDIVAFDTASFGATTSTVAGQFSDEYVNARIAEGKGKYISPDRQIDLSTALLPDTTWAIRGLRHGAWPWQIEKLALTFLQYDGEFTTETDPDYPAFLKSIPSTEEIVPMEGEPTDIMNWSFGEEDKGIVAYFRSLINWFKALFNLIGSKLGSNK